MNLWEAKFTIDRYGVGSESLGTFSAYVATDSADVKSVVSELMVHFLEYAPRLAQVPCLFGHLVEAHWLGSIVNLKAEGASD